MGAAGATVSRGTGRGASHLETAPDPAIMPDCEIPKETLVCMLGCVKTPLVLKP